MDKILKVPLVIKGISKLYDTTHSLCTPSDQTLLALWSQDLDVDLADVCGLSSDMYTHLLYVPDMWLFSASFYTVYTGPNLNCPVSITILTHYVIDVDRIVVHFYISFGNVYPWSLYSLTFRMYCRDCWNHIHSQPYLESCQTPSNYLNPRLCCFPLPNC